MEAIWAVDHVLISPNWIPMIVGTIVVSAFTLGWIDQDIFFRQKFRYRNNYLGIISWVSGNDPAPN